MPPPNTPHQTFFTPSANPKPSPLPLPSLSKPHLRASPTELPPRPLPLQISSPREFHRTPSAPSAYSARDIKNLRVSHRTLRALSPSKLFLCESSTELLRVLGVLCARYKKHPLRARYKKHPRDKNPPREPPETNNKRRATLVTRRPYYSIRSRKPITGSEYPKQPPRG